MRLVDFLFGRPLASAEDEAEKIGVGQGVPIFGLDALGSAAYGPEAALTLLIPLGRGGEFYVLPITGCILALLGILYFSYRQTIEAYPAGAGSYTVASENLGRWAGLLAGASLMIDYVLVVAVGISAGIGALVSALPAWQPYTLPLTLGVLVVLTFVNLRGVRDTGFAFVLPTYTFVGSLAIVIAVGAVKAIAAAGHPIAVTPPPHPGAAREAVGAWLLLKAFSSGCTAMTGVEAVSNGVTAFRDPASRTARRTLTVIVVLLALLLAGIAALSHVYHVGATLPDRPGYQSVLSELIGAVTGRGWFYYVAIASIALVLALQANTAFADFPRLCRAIAEDGFLPRAFANRGRRLVYTQGMAALVVLAGILLVVFGGVTDRLIPLFAVGAFLAFTLSQAGMVGHWRRNPGPRSHRRLLLNGVGAVATAITVVVVLVSKFLAGAWIVLLLIPAILVFMRSVRRHYDSVAREITCPRQLVTDHLRPPLVVVPVDEWDRPIEKALRFALTLSPDVVAVHVTAEQQDEDLGPERDGDLSKTWRERVEVPAREAGLPAPRLVVLSSPYRFVITPILQFVQSLRREHPDRQIAVVLPNLVERRWYQRFLHNQRGELLTASLLLGGDSRIVVINVPWYLAA